MSDELRDPGDYVDADGVVAGDRVIGCGEVVGVCGGGEEEESEEGAGDRLEEDVEGAVGEADEEASVWGEGVKDGVFGVRGWRQQGGRVCELYGALVGWVMRRRVSRACERTRRIDVTRMGRTHIMWMATLTLEGN